MRQAKVVKVAFQTPKLLTGLCRSALQRVILLARSVLGRFAHASWSCQGGDEIAFIANDDRVIIAVAVLVFPLC